MTADELAAIHARAMVVPPAWSAVTIEGFLDAPGAILATTEAGFALGRVAADEAELLTLAVSPDARRQGQARRCLEELERMAREKGALRLFLEVAATNDPARALYVGAGFGEAGVRKRYYRGTAGEAIDAIVMSKTLLPA
ncbi:GNAT family N-acetyltransferase [Boseongicola aestuarii]|jgi:ribosomal-protein-alanine N-acetyltransferase|uniref:Ribosomal-protein-alanine N-acetyltransferase n=1 Tax=Boseongicola aestuarii TaxID=1470561 RepID=A0A238IY36_9RHOB|nr:GNAT family N-acetyltransferase [Boseongicola aestuarii]SMX22775.1 ribosomal-protein-alanine N-acetyltransferase [Boseongicola aestuarii]